METVDPIEDCLAYCKSKLSSEQLMQLCEQLQATTDVEVGEAEVAEADTESMLMDELNDK